MTGVAILDLSTPVVYTHLRHTKDSSCEFHLICYRGTCKTHILRSVVFGNARVRDYGTFFIFQNSLLGFHCQMSNLENLAESKH